MCVTVVHEVATGPRSAGWRWRRPDPARAASVMFADAAPDRGREGWLTRPAARHRPTPAGRRQHRDRRGRDRSWRRGVRPAARAIGARPAQRAVSNRFLDIPPRQCSQPMVAASCSAARAGCPRRHRWRSARSPEGATGRCRRSARQASAAAPSPVLALLGWPDARPRPPPRWPRAPPSRPCTAPSTRWCRDEHDNHGQPGRAGRVQCPPLPGRHGAVSRCLLGQTSASAAPTRNPNARVSVPSYARVLSKPGW